jgi:uncharacterized protein
MANIKRAILRWPGKEALSFTALTLLSLAILLCFVDLTPKVDENFFFASNDPQFQSEKRISERFSRKDAQIIISAAGNIRSKKYYRTIAELGAALEAIPSVLGVRSVTDGPANINDAVSSPLWKRLLISKDLKSTNIIVLIDDKKAAQSITPIESIIKEFSNDDFQLSLSGLPYIVELIQRNLTKDLTHFSFLAFGIFGIVILCIFRSGIILSGAMVTCLNAGIWTFMTTNLMGIPIGILTANLTTIIFVLTLSHCVFLTYNWRKFLSGDSPKEALKNAVDFTLPASFWSMITTLLGFLSLLAVPAKPLRELGLSGSIGAIIAITAAYGIYPSFLRMVRVNSKNGSRKANISKKFYSFLSRNAKSIRIALFSITLIALPGLWLINNDPSMLSFFSKDGEIYKGLEYIDRNGGSSPLIMVAKSKDGRLLNSQGPYQDLWKLQLAFEEHHSVGSVISLPVLIAQAKEHPLAGFLFIDWLLNILEKPQHNEIAKSFVSADRKLALFLLRMNELNRKKSRLEIIDEIKNLVRTHNFEPEIVGGVYALQGHLSKLVTSSLIFGLTWLIFLFLFISWIVARSWKFAAAMTVSIVIVPVCVLGYIGLCRIPLDIISAPASNVAIAMGIDSMIHMAHSWRRQRKNNRDGKLWDDIRNQMWRPILTTTVIVVAGFSVFLFSTFPPTQRFGIAIVFGSILAALVSLYVVPWLECLDPFGHKIKEAK